MNNAQRKLWLASLLVMLAAGLAMAQESEPAGIETALTSGETKFSLRYRYEFVDQAFNRATGEPFDKNANASTLLIRLNQG